VLGGVRRTQVGLLYSALKLQEPTDDIVDDLPVMQTLFGEFIPPTPEDGLHTPRGFVAEVQDALRFEARHDAHLTSHQNSCSVQLTQPRKENNNKTVLGGLSEGLIVPLSPDGLLCTMHSKSPCTPTGLRKGSTEGPWFERTISLSLSLGNPVDSVTQQKDSEATQGVGLGESLCSAKGASSKDVESCKDQTGTKSARRGILSETPTVSIVSQAVEGCVEKPMTNRTVPVDTSLDDVISRTSQKCDGRYTIFSHN
jgi:hypothetical protein